MVEEQSDKQLQKRQVAFKVMIKDILRGNYVKDDGWNPNYIVLQDNRQVSRVNIIAVVINKQFGDNATNQSITIDDGSGQLNLRSFDNNTIFEDINIGEMILIIGRVREFGSERYATPEIIRKINDKHWFELRKQELGKVKTQDSHKDIVKQAPQSNQEKEQPEIEAVVEELVEEDNSIISVVKNLDKGGGADFNEVLEHLKIDNAENIIENMIKSGELFQITPGKIKVLD